MTIQQLKNEAIALNLIGDWRGVAEVIRHLDIVWQDDDAAMRFYTFLESKAP